MNYNPGQRVRVVNMPFEISFLDNEEGTVVRLNDEVCRGCGTVHNGYLVTLDNVQPPNNDQEWCFPTAYLVPVNNVDETVDAKEQELVS